MHSIFIKLMTLIFPMSILVQPKYYTFAEYMYELTEKEFTEASLECSFSAPFLCAERSSCVSKRSFLGYRSTERGCPMT